jgi:iron complex outermembrane recepter protein
MDIAVKHLQLKQRLPVKQIFKPISAAVFAALFHGLVQAQQAPVQPLNRVVIEGQRDDYKTPTPAGTATKTDTPVLLTPQSLQTVSRSVIEDQMALSISDAIRNISGVGLDFGFNGSDLPIAILRGFPSVSMSARGPMAGSAAFYSDGKRVQGVPVNMANVESVEVIKGPASVLYGRSEPGGMINVNTRQPQNRKAIGAELTLGSWGTRRALVEATGPLSDDGTWLGRGAASYASADSARRLVTDRLSALSGELIWQPSAQTRAAFKLDLSRQKYRNDYGVPALGDRPARPGRDVPPDAQYNDAPELSNNRVNALQFDLAQKLSSQWQIKAHALASSSRAAQVDVTPYRLDLATFDDCLARRGQLCRYYFSARPDLKSDTMQANVDLIGNLATGGIQHTLLLGVDAYRFKADAVSYFQTLPPIDIRNPLYGQAPPLDPAQALMTPEQSRSRWVGVYVQDQLDLGNGLNLVAALRRERNSARYGDPAGKPNNDGYTTPRMGAVWAFAANQSVYAQYQDSVAANNGRNLRGDALQAERARQFEVGHKIEALGGKLASTLAVYQLSKRNLSSYLPSTDPAFAGQFDTATIGAARSRGLEWDVSGQLTQDIALIGSYAYTQTEVTEDVAFKGKRLANAPRHSGSLWMRWKAGGGWSAGAGVFAQGQRQGDQANSFQLPGYARIDAMLAYRFKLGGSDAQVQLNVNNLFDRLYYTGSHQFVQDWIAVGAKRNALATLRLDY